MSGDYSRRTFDPRDHFSGVLMQQGRVQLDADWNEQGEILDRRWRAETTDVVGRCGVPDETPNGFKIENVGGSLTIGRGRVYVDGILAENHGIEPWEFDRILAERRGSSDTAYDDQPYPTPDPSVPPAGRHLVYVDVWQREVTHIEDPDIVEKAVGVDTTARMQAVWQVKILPNVGASVTCATPNDQIPGWLAETEPSAGRLTTDEVTLSTLPNPCLVPESGGYRGLENRLYRVEIHDGGPVGTATFKWSRHRVASTVTAIPALDQLAVVETGRDPVLQFEDGQWIEVRDDNHDFSGEPGVIRQIQHVDPATQTITLEDDLPTGMFATDPVALADRHTRIQRWDQSGEVLRVDETVYHDLDAPASVGVIPVPDATTSLILEDGVQVTFTLDSAAGTEFHTGDYWLLAARASDASVEILDEAVPVGIHHHYCRLALVDSDGTQFVGIPDDCRPTFPPLTDLPVGSGCCVRVEPGDNLQQAIDRAIANGGGCLCLSRGVHNVEGPLVLNDARNLSIHGEGQASILRLTGTNQDGVGGVVLQECRDISFDSMLIIGEDTPALLWARSPDLFEPNRGVTLRDLTLINLTQSDNDIRARGAIRLGHAADFHVEHCRVLAEIGIIATFGDRLPISLGQADELEKYGSGVEGLVVRDTRIAYQSTGVWSLMSDRWKLENCHVWRLSEDRLGTMIGALQGLGDEQLAAQLFEHLDSVFEPRSDTSSGTAIKVFEWRDSVLRDCRLFGERGVDVWWWFRGEATGNDVSAGERGLHAAWVHDAHWANNRVQCTGGYALSFLGAYRSVVTANHLRGGVGLANLEPSAEIGSFGPYVSEVTAIYFLGIPPIPGFEDPAAWEYLAWYMLVKELVRFTGIVSLFTPYRNLLGGIDPLMILVPMIYLWVYNEDRIIQPPPVVVDLRAGRNDIEGTQAGVFIDKVLTVGGCSVVQNELNTIGGQSIRINTNVIAANPHVMIAAWRWGLRYLVRTYIPDRIAEVQADPEMNEPTKAATIESLENLETLAGTWAEQSESFMDADYRIEGNSVHSSVTGIESNIWGVSIRQNHVTMQESGYSNRDSFRVFDALSLNAYTAPLAYAVRDGSRRNVYRATDAFRDEEFLSNRNDRGGAAAALYDASTGLTNDKMARSGSDLANAVNDGNFTLVQERLPDFAATLASLTDNYGIWAKGPGCRIEGNHVLVPRDADPTSWGRGGIKVSTDTDDQENAIDLAVLLLLISLLDVDPLLGITETLVDDNEVIGGFGHGIHIDAPIVLLEFQLSMTNLKVRRNEVVGMAGAGVVVDGETLAVGVDISHNKVADCSADPKLADLTNEKGGITIENAALCRLEGNRIQRCGANQQTIDVFGLDFQSIYGLTLDGNYLLHNGRDPSSIQNGSMRLVDVFGDVQIDDNESVFPGGVGLVWSNSVNGGDFSVLPASLIVQLNFFILRVAPGADVVPIIALPESATARGAVHGGHFTQSSEDVSLAVSIFNLTQLDFSHNSCSGGGGATGLGSIRYIDRGLLNDNLLSTNAQWAIWVRRFTGVVTNNVGNRPIRVVLSPGTQIGINVPPVV